MRVLRIDRFTVEPELGLITGSEPVRVEPKSMQVLLCLAAHPGEVVSKERIMRTVWKDTFVTEDVLVRAIGALRRTFGDEPKNPRMLQTISGEGYRLIAPVSEETTFDSIAVLPFDNLSGDPGQEYFVDGMTDAVITALAQIPVLKVISRTSVMHYKKIQEPLTTIAEKLGVDIVVEGCVLKDGGRVRISAQLIEAATDRHLWAGSYERSLTEILDLQSEVAGKIVSEIRPRLAPARARESTEGKRAVRPTVYESYLKGMFHVNKFTREGFEKGIACLHEAVAGDPADPLPYVGLAVGYSLIGHSPAPPPEAYPRARAAALTALKLDETHAEAHEALAEVSLYYDYDFPAARRSFRRALELNPSLPEGRRHHGWYLLLSDRFDEALQEMRRAAMLDPLTPLYSAELGWMHWSLAQYEEAVQEAEKSLELNPDFPVGLFVLGGVRGAMGHIDEAIAAHQRAAAVSPDWKWGLGITWALAGQQDKAKKIAADLEAEKRPWNAFVLALIYAALGETVQACDRLEQAREHRHSWIPWISHVPFFKPLAGEPRFENLLRRIHHGSAAS